MLRELANTRQVDGEPVRRWYFSPDQDLVVWFDPTDQPLAFQLAYGERSVSWHPTRGYRHYIVEEKFAGWFGTPFLNEGGVFPKEEVISQFRSLSKELPAPVIAFVCEKLETFEGPTYSSSHDPLVLERAERQAELLKRVERGELVIDHYRDSATEHRSPTLQRSLRWSLKSNLWALIPQFMLGGVFLALVLLTLFYS